MATKGLPEHRGNTEKTSKLGANMGKKSKPVVNTGKKSKLVVKSITGAKQESLKAEIKPPQCLKEVRPYLIEMAKRDKDYAEILQHKLEKKPKSEIILLDDDHPSKRISHVWDELGTTPDGALVAYRKQRILVPRKARRGIINLAHGEHLGWVGIANKVSKKYYWCLLKTNVQKALAECKDCV